MGDGVGAGAGSDQGLRAPVPARDVPSGAGGGAAESVQGRRLAFAIPLALPTVNVLLRMHWAKRRKLQKRVQQECWAALLDAGHYRRTRSPMARCAITVQRHSQREPDPDAMHSTAKMLLDVLQPTSAKHPLGLGVIAEDSSGCIASLQVFHCRGRGRTEVEITEVRDDLRSTR